MPTFVVRFVRFGTDAFRGKVRHIPSGEEAVFSSPADLLTFFERLNAVSRTGMPPEDRACRAPGNRRGIGREREETR